MLNEQIVPTNKLQCFSLDGGRVVKDEVKFLPCRSIEEINDFISQRDLLPKYLRCFLHLYSAEEYIEFSAQVYITTCKQGGYALIGKELVSVFSLPGAHLGDYIVADAVANGATELFFMDASGQPSNHQDSSKGKLYKLYERHGFVEVARSPWIQDLAQPDWDYLHWGEPNAIFMKLER